MRDEVWILAVALGAGIFAFTQPGCRTLDAGKRIAPSEVVNDQAPVSGSSVPADFLATEYAPLAAWFDERFEVEYRNMTPALIFDQDPIGDIRYDVRAMPANLPLFHLQDSNISRREILYQVARSWNLTMKIEEVDGKPSIVTVTGPPAVTLSGP
jgi:hypothetical protein